MHVPSKVSKCSPIRSCRFGRSNVPTLKTTPEGLENAPDILAQIFLEISDLTATGAAPRQKKVEIFWRFERAGERNGWFARGVMG